VFETRFPWRIEELELTTDSGGPGMHRGGLGYQKTLLCLNERITCSQMTDRHLLAPWGLNGGGEGGKGATLVQKSGSTAWQTMIEAYGKRSTSRYSNVSIRKGDRVRMRTPGGGGFGDPKARPPGLVAEDIREGYVSEEAARKLYGYRGELK